MRNRKLTNSNPPRFNKSGLISFFILITLTGLHSLLFAQIAMPENRYFHFEGTMGQKKNMVLDLHKFGDSIFGTYYNQTDGQLHYFAGKTNHSVSFSAVKKNGDSIIGEFVNHHKINGYSCNSKGGSKREFSFTETDYFGSMSFDAFIYNRTYDFTDKPLYPTFKVELMYLYPANHHNKAVEDSVQDYIIGYYFGHNITFNTNENMLKFLSNNYYQSYASHYKTNAFDYRSSLLKWSVLQDVQIIFNDNFVLTFCLNQTSSDWHKEPLWERMYFVINLKTGNRITPDAIFVTGYREKLKKLITEKLQKQFNTTTTLQAEGFYKSQIKKFDNLYINREGIGFHYNPGDIAPKIFGEIDVFFRYDELKEILLTKGIVYTLVQ